MQSNKIRNRIMSIPPKRDITVEELDKFLRQNGFELSRTAKSSHPLYVHKKYKDLIVGFANPHPRKEIKINYIKNIQSVIEMLEERLKDT